MMEWKTGLPEAEDYDEMSRLDWDTSKYVVKFQGWNGYTICMYLEDEGVCNWYTSYATIHLGKAEKYLELL